ncbi:hypothetical protein SteCoe_23027 [Stentor coeruleus]|uniref:Uncharacterized protein n=1 Tax=Stentor coeruleus TaxID=5963 RepID=A0A1R2BKT9_9CILI|nr:hypothetical protein SteCoe_23027 [Stentor coeruleus]
MQLRYRSSRDLFNLEASHTEIITDFKELECSTPAKRVMFSPEPSQKKRRNKKSNQTALSGVLGLASLISDRDLEDKKLPEHWFQQYPLSTNNTWDYLPTGIPLQGKSLLSASFDVYYQDRNPLK